MTTAHPLENAVLGQPAVDGAKPGDDDIRLWSVTTIIGCLDKPALLYWSAEETAKAAIANQRSWQAILDEQGDQEAIDWLANARFRKPKGARSAKDLGTAVHEACEQYALTGVKPEVDPEVLPFLDMFDMWCDRFQPEYQAAEVTVYHPDYGYAGTADAFLTVGGVRCIVDYKSSRKAYDKRGKPTSPYPEVALQLAAYRYAGMAAVWRPRRFEHMRRRYYLLGAEERAMAVPVPEVDGGLVIHITPQHCNAFPVKCDESVFETFLYVQEAARWCFQTSRSVIGDPLTPEDDR